MAGLWTNPVIKLPNYWNLVIEMWKTGKNVILNNVDYLWKRINADILSDNISEVILSVAIKDANEVAICACVLSWWFNAAKN